MKKKINVANPGANTLGEKPFLFGFGSVGTTWVLAYGYSLDEALEEAADWLHDRKLWGHITPHDGTDVGTYALGCDCPDPFDCDSHTYTEAGWLSSEEWFVQGVDWDRDAIISFYRQLTRR